MKVILLYLLCFSVCFSQEIQDEKEITAIYECTKPDGTGYLASQIQVDEADTAGEAVDCSLSE